MQWTINAMGRASILQTWAMCPTARNTMENNEFRSSQHENKHSFTPL